MRISTKLRTDLPRPKMIFKLLRVTSPRPRTILLLLVKLGTRLTKSSSKQPFNSPTLRLPGKLLLRFFKMPQLPTKRL